MLNYVKACTDAFLFYQVKRQDLQGKRILTVNEKYYVADHGIREAVFGGNMKDINLVLENIVYMELLRRGYTVTVGKVSDKEIDFVCEDQGSKLYVQVPDFVQKENLELLYYGEQFEDILLNVMDQIGIQYQLRTIYFHGLHH